MNGDLALARFVEDLSELAIVMLDRNGVIDDWNAGAQLLFGFPLEEVEGRHLAIICRDGAERLIDDALIWGQHQSTCTLVAKSGAHFEANVMLKPVRDAHNRHIGFGLIAFGPQEIVFRQEPQAAGLVPAHGAKILLVDDDDGVRVEIEEQLRDMGHEVVAASSGEEALKALERAGDFDVLFTDVVMPSGIGGRDLADRARQVRPSLKVLFLSGYLQNALQDRGDLDAGAICLAKPYRRAELSQALDNLLLAGA
ncbi:response regulator [Reyranella sp.]|uniref:response regulator n=1 Tax=Reyranella sp. TaxID=1929291 RepID=UPI003BACE72A